MRGLVACCLIWLVGCGDDDASTMMCPPGTHMAGEACVEDTMCLPTTCGEHGTCSVVGDVLDCACETGYTGTNCGGCAAGFQDHGNTGVCSEACAMQCGRFGQCDDSSGTIACTCRRGTTGPACDDCEAPTVTIINDTFGARGQHHTLDVSAGAFIVAALPALGGAAQGDVTFGTIAGMPTGGSQSFKLFFSRCPGEITFAEDTHVGGASPCLFMTNNVAGGSIHWTETGTPSTTLCLLPPGDGPWYANLKVDFAPSIETCDDTVPCKMDWVWN